MRNVLLFWLITMGLTSFLFGCLSNQGESKAQGFDLRLDEIQKVIVLSPELLDSQTTITDRYEINQFVDEIKTEDWKLMSVPSDAVKGKKIKLYQEETINLGQTNEKQKELVEMAVITLYEDVPYIDFAIKNSTFSFKVPKKSAKFLSDY